MKPRYSRGGEDTGKRQKGKRGPQRKRGGQKKKKSPWEVSHSIEKIHEKN